MNFVRPLGDDINVSDFGGKAANLSSLIRAGLPVPQGFAVGLGAFYDDGSLTVEAKTEINKILISGKNYAVRSSALAEDAEGASWAGQFETFLDTKYENILTKIEECHNSTKTRAKAYAIDKTGESEFKIAVVVQEMLHPEYSGVLFTKDPLSGEDKLVTEFIKGVGEDLVSGKADPKRFSWSRGQKVEAPFDIEELSKLSIKTEEIFGTPQDIEWAWTDGKMWLVQARPITATQELTKGHHLGEPEELFYWGPSRTKPMYMSDWLAACERVFIKMSQDDKLPTPPKTLVIFCSGKMVFLCNAEKFRAWCEQSFEIYSADQIESDLQKWKNLTSELPSLHGEDFSKNIVDAWSCTIIPEFALYGAESSIAKYLDRFEPKTKQKIWGAFTTPDKLTFLARIDTELSSSRDPAAMAKKYPWIQDGYDGLATNANEYFEERLKLIGDEVQAEKDSEIERDELIKTLGLTNDEINALTLARKLAEFMDDRKAWMMQTRRLIKEPLLNIENGWVFDTGKVEEIDESHAEELWQRYVNFKSSSSAVKGIVASNGGRHFINGEVVVISNPADSIAEDKILVVPSTSPSYVPLMRKAKALITDHGGMMSHAAIVAREFNLPCIVGTKQATKVLKNGDEVVLDLVKGEVNK